MVFHTHKRRVRAKPQHEADTSLLDLPDELILAILEHTDSIIETLRLRQTSKILVPACNSTTRDRLKTLYIHPRQSSVERAIEICESDWASDIEEICFIDRLNWKMIRTPAQSGKKFGHTWPSLRLHEQKKKLNSDFSAHYEVLLSSLVSIPKVKTLSFKDTCDQPGYNMVSEQAIKNWTFTVQEAARTWDAIMERRKSNRLEKLEDKLYGPIAKGTPNIKARQGFSFSDLDAVIAVLTRLNITTLKLSDEPPSANQQSLSTTSLEHLTHIELLVHLGWHACPWQRFCNELLRKAAPTLQNLKLSFKHNPAAIRRKRAETSFATVVSDLAFPKLRSLELRALGLPEELPYVPQVIGLMGFLSRCENLEFLRMSRVFPTSQYILIAVDPDNCPSLDEVLLDFEGEARLVEESDEHTRAWEISV
jgi:hypothetical protein